MKEELTELKNKISELEGRLSTFASEFEEIKEWKNEREKQQIREPLDETSQLIIDNRRIKS